MPHATIVSNATRLYDEDFFAWTRDQARLLRERRFSELDVANLAEEVESVGRSQQREVRSRMSVLLSHLLKWAYQPGRRSRSWRATIRDQRSALRELLADSPSLSRTPSEMFAQTYLAGRLAASNDTGIDFTLFPEAPPLTVEQTLDDTFLPKEPDLHDPS